MEKIALLPGGFKPPHAGHYNMAKWLVANTDADSVVIKIGSKERDGITRDISLKLWDLYRKSDKDSGKLVIVPSEQNSPVRDVYDFIEQDAPEGSTVYLGMGEKDIEDQRFKNIGKFAEPKNIKFKTVLVPPQAGGVSGTEMRGFISSDDKESFQQYLPDHLNAEQKDEAWGIVSSIQEDFYDPRNKMLDYMRSSEWKAGMPDGSKKDIPRTKNQIHNRQRNPHAHMSENNLNEQIYIPEDAGCMQFCDPVDFEDSNNLLGEEQLLIVPICLPGYKPEDSEFIESYQFMFGYNNNILQWNQQYSQMVSQMPQLFGLSNALAGGMGIQSENQPGVVSYAFATGEAFDWSETDVLTYLVFVVTGNGTSNFTWNQNAGGTDVNPNMTSYYVYGVTDCFEDGSASVGVEEEDVCTNFEQYASTTYGIETWEFCVKCESNSYTDEECGCCSEGLPEPEGLPLKDKAPLKDKPKKEPIKIKPPALTKEWWAYQIKKILTEGGAAGHMAHPFNLPNVNSGKDLLDVFNKAAESLEKDPGSVKIDGVNSSIRLIDLDGEKQFVMDRGSKKELDVKGITKDDLLNRFGDGHGMVKIGGEVLDMFNKALPSIKGDLEKLGAYDDPNILFNMEYVSGKTNVQDYGSNFIAIHGLNKIETKEVQGKRKMLTKRVSSEISYDKSDLQSLLNNLTPTAKEKGFEVYGSVPTEMTKKPNFNSALSKSYTIEAGENTQTKSLNDLLNELNNIPEEDFIFMNVNNSRKKVGAVSKQVYLAILNGENVDDLFEDEDDKQKAIEGFTTYLATEKLGDEVLKVLNSPMGSVENHEGVVIRDEKIANVPFKITGKFILGGMVSDF